MMKSKTTEDIDELLARHFANETLTDGQQAELNRWIAENYTEYENMRRLVDSAGDESEYGKMQFDTEKAWNRIEPQLKGRRAVFTPARKKTAAILSVAASVAVLFVIAVFFTMYDKNEDFVRYANATEKVKRVILSDSSEVILYPKTTLAFASRTKDNARLARLEGKAFFNVRKDHGRAFRIDAGTMQVEVLGTSFLVDAAGKNSGGVFVKTGKVKVTAGKEKAILTANDKVELKNGNMQTGTISDPETFFGQKEKTIVFSNTPITEAVKEIKEKTGVTIELGRGLETNKVTTRIDTRNKSSIAAELAIICGCRCDTLETERHYRLYYE